MTAEVPMSQTSDPATPTIAETNTTAGVGVGEHRL